MTPEERQLVDGLFARIRANPPADRDPEAERLIGDQVARDPSAAYALVQMTLVQEHALRLAEERIRQLEQAAPPPSSGRSFLGGLLPSSGQRAGSVPASGTGAWGGGGAGAAAPPPFPGQAAPPPYPGQAAPRGGGFLRSAMATAAGVAGGALLFEGISSLFRGNPGPFGGGSFGGALGGQAAAATPPAAAPADAGPWGGGGGHEPALDKPFDKPLADDGSKADADLPPDEGGYDQASDAQQDYGDDSFDGGGGGDDLSNT